MKQSGLFNTTKAKVEATALLGVCPSRGTFNLVQGSRQSHRRQHASTAMWPTRRTASGRSRPRSTPTASPLLLRHPSAEGRTGRFLPRGRVGRCSPTAPTTFDLVSEVNAVLAATEPSRPERKHHCEVRRECRSQRSMQDRLRRRSSPRTTPMCRLKKPASVDPSAQFDVRTSIWTLDKNWAAQRPSGHDRRCVHSSSEIRLRDSARRTPTHFRSAQLPQRLGVLKQTSTATSQSIASKRSMEPDWSCGLRGRHHAG